MATRLSFKSLLLLVAFLSIVCLSVAFVIQHTTKPTPKGTSEFAPLDIVSGEVSTSDLKSTLHDLSTLTKKSLTGSDLSIRPGSYKKIFGTTSDNYTVQFITDISPAKSSYLVTIQVVNGSSIGPYEACASEQKAGYSCTPPVVEGE